MATTGRRQFLISKVWIQAAVLVFLCGFFVLGLLAYRTYQAAPPVPERVVDARRGLLFTCLLYTSPSPRDISGSRMPSSA